MALHYVRFVLIVGGMIVFLAMGKYIETIVLLLLAIWGELWAMPETLRLKRLKISVDPPANACSCLPDKTVSHFCGIHGDPTNPGGDCK
jgi:hypothetical protein